MTGMYGVRGSMVALCAILLPAAALPETIGPRAIRPQAQPTPPARPAGAAAAGRWRDLNRNGRMDPYEDRRAPIEARIDDLLGRMTRAEKAASLAHGNLIGLGSEYGGSTRGYNLEVTRDAILKRGVTSFITRITVDPRTFARENNAIQAIAARGRLGIPVMISTDPRNQFQVLRGAMNQANGFSVWPDPIGLAAIDDAALVRTFGDIVRQEYRAVGLHMALSPQADLTTHPRWSRIAATFGSDPDRVSRLVEAEIAGLQGGADGLRPNGVAAVVKHWVGYGTGADGFDPHNAYGKDLLLDDAELRRHVRAFKGAFRARTAAVMTTYGILRGVTVDGRPVEPVAAGFSQQITGDLLRRDERYDGLVVSDWGIVNDCPATCTAPSQAAPQTLPAIGMPWGVESLSIAQRTAKSIMAGTDQIGGLDDPAPILAALDAGDITAARLDEAVRRVLRVKFALGLFDEPFVDPDAAPRLVGTPASQRLADRAQRASITRIPGTAALAPLRRGQTVWLFGVSEAAARAAGLVPVARPDQANAAIIRMKTPSETLHPWHFFGSMQPEGRLDFRPGDPGFDALVGLRGRMPVHVAIDMDRPAAVANLRGPNVALLALFGSSDAALLDVLKTPSLSRGRLPYPLPD